MPLKLITLLLCLLAINANTTRAELPHTFQAGQTAKASEVNENFAYVNKTNYVLKANGVVVGDVVSLHPDKAEIINKKGFFMAINKTGHNLSITAEPLEPLYGNGECTGTMYVVNPLVNTVYSTNYGYYYAIARNDVYLPPVISQKHGNTCYSVIPQFVVNLSELKKNDPSITGFEESEYIQIGVHQQPITVEIR